MFMMEEQGKEIARLRKINELLLDHLDLEYKPEKEVREGAKLVERTGIVIDNSTVGEVLNNMEVKLGACSPDTWYSTTGYTSMGAAPKKRPYKKNCDQCGYKAKSKKGLAIHKGRNHKS